MSAAQELPDLEREQLEASWLYRQGDLVLGPLSGQQLVAKLYAGEVTGITEVSSTGPSGFRKLQDTDGFALHADAFEDHAAQGASVFILSETGASSAAARTLAGTPRPTTVRHLPSSRPQQGTMGTPAAGAAPATEETHG